MQGKGRSDDDLLDILRHVHLAYLPGREGGLDTIKEWKDGKRSIECCLMADLRNFC